MTDDTTKSHSTRLRNRLPSIGRDGWRALTLSLLLVLSLPAMSLVFTGFDPINPDDSDGIVAADEEDYNDLVFAGEDADSGQADISGHDPATGDQVWESETHNQGIYDLAVSPDDKTVYSGDRDGVLRSIDIETGEVNWQVDLNSNDDAFSGLTISPTGKYLYAKTNSGSTHKLDASSGDEEWSSSVSSNGGGLSLASENENLHAVDAEYYYIYDTSDGEIEKQIELNGGGKDVAVSPNEDAVYILDDSPTQSPYLTAYDATSSEEIWEIGASGGIGAVSVSKDSSTVYWGSTGQGVNAVDADTGDDLWESSTIDDGVISLEVSGDDSTIYAGADGGTVAAVDADTAEVLWSSGSPSYAARAVAATGSSGLGEISGQVVDQSGNPVEQEDITVEAWGVNEPNFDEADLGDLEDRVDSAEELAEELEDSLPEDFEEFRDDYGVGDTHLDPDQFTNDFDDTGVYPLVHSEDDWGSGYTTVISNEVDEPRVQVDEGDEIILSLWDLEEQPTGLREGIFEGPVHGSHPGAVTDGTIVVQQLDPWGDPLNTRELETTVQFEASPSLATPGGGEEYHAVRTSLPPGIYQAYPEGQRERAYTFVVGDPADLSNAMFDNVRNEADQLTQRAENMRSLLDQGVIERERTTTNANGEFELFVSPGPREYNVQAYRADEDILEVMDALEDGDTERTFESFEDLSIDDLREYRLEADSTGAFILPAETGTVEPGQQNAEVRVVRTNSLPWEDMEQYDDLMDRLEDEFLNETVSELEDGWDELVDELDDDRLRELTEQYRAIVDGDQDLEDAIEEILERELEDIDDTDTDELREELEAIRDELENVENRVDLENGEIEIEDGLVNAWFPVRSWVDESDVLVEYRTSSGETRAIDDEYISLESDGPGPFGGQQVVVDEYPLEDDVAAADISLQILGDEGYGESTVGFQNPQFAGDVPDVRAIDLNTMAPGEGERVSMTVRPAHGEQIDNVTGIDVFGPDAEPVDAEIRGDDRATFRTSGAGEYFVRLSIDTGGPGDYVTSFRVRALEDGRSDPPTVRVERTTGGQYVALAGDGLRDAEIERDGSALQVRAIAPADAIPGDVHVRPGSLGEEIDRYEVRLLEGSDERQVSSRVETVIHTDHEFSDGAAVWRGEPAWIAGNPLQVDDTTRFGEIDVREDKTVIRTFTEPDGSLTITSHDPASTLQGIQHSVASSIPTPSFPFLSLSTGVGASVAGAFTIGVALWRRRVAV